MRILVTLQAYQHLVLDILIFASWEDILNISLFLNFLFSLRLHRFRIYLLNIKPDRSQHSKGACEMGIERDNSRQAFLSLCSQLLVEDTAHGPC